MFRFQYSNVQVYRQYVSLLGVDPCAVDCIEKIPFLPIEFFKTHTIIAHNATAQTTFTSSGTTGDQTSRHNVADLSLYEESFTCGFELLYGHPSQYCILALLPSYMERTGSSLVYMANSLIEQSGNRDSGFFLNNYHKLAEQLQLLDSSGQKCLLLGVSFALLDLAEQFPIKLRNTIIMETGGMKGKRKEITRNELHATLCATFGVKTIHSEYGMTELLSQAYSSGNGIFRCPPWMRVLINETSDPLTVKRSGSGAINVIDLANRYSCSFIKTQDAGRVHADGSFEVLGRLDSAPIRGCNLLVY